jgi:undecaprenyl diphosphate synthase
MNKPLKHLAIIPDGNRRWAKKHKLQSWLGHKQGTAKVNEIGEAAIKHGATYITFWASSVDNLTKRSKTEVHYLLQYFYEVLVDPATWTYIKKYNVRVRVLGRWKELVSHPKLQEAISNMEAASRKHSRAYLTILLGYDGKEEMLAAVNRTKSKGQVTEAALRRSLATGYLPDVDMVIRTGGEPHWSAGFLMWLSANTQLYFTDILWPDFGPKQLAEAFKDYKRRERRMGR